jgi:hypothetical protein
MPATVELVFPTNKFPLESMRARSVYPVESGDVAVANLRELLKKMDGFTSPEAPEYREIKLAFVPLPAVMVEAVDDVDAAMFSFNPIPFGELVPIPRFPDVSLYNWPEPILTTEVSPVNPLIVGLVKTEPVPDVVATVPEALGSVSVRFDAVEGGVRVTDPPPVEFSFTSPMSLIPL